MLGQNNKSRQQQHKTNICNIYLLEKCSVKKNEDLSYEKEQENKLPSLQ